MITPTIVFAKAPRPGDVKTRLVPALGTAGAVSLHEWMVARALATAAAAALGPVELCCAPDATHPFLAACAVTHGVSLAEQGPGDLGERMQRAAARALAANRAVLIIGSDCPALTPDYLRAAVAALSAGYDAAVGPAEDGGYVLIGLTRVHPTLFGHICWGGPDVMKTTAARLAALGWRWMQLAPLWDVDRPEDLLRLRREIPHGEWPLAAVSHDNQR